MANGAVECSADSRAAEASPDAASRGRGLRRWRRIPREQHHTEGSGTAAAVAAGGGGGGGGAADDDAAQLHKRRLPVGADAPPKGKQEVAVDEEERERECSAASVESRFVALGPPPAKLLDPDLGLLVASAGFSVGADSDNNSEDRSSKSSTAASAPRDRGDTARPSMHGKNPHAARGRADRAQARAYAAFSPAEAENSRSSVESDRRSSNAVNGWKPGVGAMCNGIHKVFSDGDDRSDEEQPSEEARSTAGGYYKQNGSSVAGRLVRGSVDSGDADVEDTLDEGSVEKGENGLGMNSGADPYAESILLLQRTQEALENEIQKFVVIRKESSDNFDAHDGEWSGSVHLEEPVEEAGEKIKDLESRIEEASALINEKDSRIFELEALSRTQAWRTAIQSNNLLLLQPDLDQLLQEKMEAEIQCIILTRASQTWTPLPLPQDQTDLYEQQKSLSEDYKQLELKLRHAENRATVLGEMVEKQEAQCKELSACSEILQLQSRASSVSLFCFIQFILLCIAIGTFIMRLLPSSTEVVPT